ncbi:MAG: hypothetical protein FJ388_16150 [Verrucomicrobia bacterium]|nr:hypothetical protein [Verrucomicrobiota bacterium]
MNKNLTRRGFVCRSSLAITALFAGRAPAKEKPCEANRYLDIVRRYANTMIEHGRDAYGAVKSPLFAATLDRKTLKLPEKKPGGISGIREGDRTLTGANPMHDENLYQILYALTRVTGDKRYAREADAALKWFFEHCQGPKGLMAWGEHLGWDFIEDKPCDPSKQAIHEYYRPWVLWERCFKLAPDACRRAALGLWQHQIGDPKAGRYSRHAMNIWDKDKVSGRVGYEFPRHGGFYIATWAAAFAHTKDKTMLTAIESLVDGYQKRRDPKSGAIPSATGHADLLWPQSNLSLAIDLWSSAPKVPSKIAAKMRDCAKGCDETFLKLAHDLSPDGPGFVKSAHTSTLEPGDVRAQQQGTQKGGRFEAYTQTWVTGYGLATDAMTAMLCLMRYQQVKRDGYKKLFLAAADRYLRRDPDLTITLYPGAVAEAIAVLIGAHRLTRDAKFLNRAEVFAKIACDVFFKDSPLPSASSKNDHYEAITRGDTLVMVLLDLWAARAKPRADLGLVWTDR